MHETSKVQHIPVKVYRSADRLMVAAPMPGLQAEDITAHVSENGRLIIEGEVRGMLKDMKELLIDEWTVGGYYRELELPDTVDAIRANVNYGNGVLVITFPLSSQTQPADLTLAKSGQDKGERVGVGNSGHRV